MQKYNLIKSYFYLRQQNSVKKNITYILKIRGFNAQNQEALQLSLQYIIPKS